MSCLGSLVLAAPPDSLFGWDYSSQFPTIRVAPVRVDLVRFSLLRLAFGLRLFSSSNSSANALTLLSKASVLDS